MEQTILYINPDASRCGYCRMGADPREKQHVTVLDWSASGTRKGCGRTFTAVSSDYAMTPELAEAITDMRPDLPFAGPLN